MSHFHRKPDNGKHISSFRLQKDVTILRSVVEEISKNPKHEIEWERLSELYKGNTNSVITVLFSMFNQKIEFSVLNVPEAIHKRISNSAKVADIISKSVYAGSKSTRKPRVSTEPKTATRGAGVKFPYAHEGLLRERIETALVARGLKSDRSTVSRYHMSITKQLARENFRDANERLERAEVLLKEFLGKHRM